MSFICVLVACVFGVARTYTLTQTLLADKMSVPLACADNTCNETLRCIDFWANLLFLAMCLSCAWTLQHSLCVNPYSLGAQHHVHRWFTPYHTPHLSTLLRGRRGRWRDPSISQIMKGRSSTARASDDYGCVCLLSVAIPSKLQQCWFRTDY